MNTIHKLHAADVMQTEVLTLEPQTTIADAIRMLEENRISAAPVVDSSNHVIGMLSARDIARAERFDANEAPPPVNGDRSMVETQTDELEDDSLNELVFFDRADYSPESGGGATVEEWMNPDFAAVPPDRTLDEVCRIMLRNRVHHVPVVRGRKLEGIISTIDVVRCVARDSKLGAVEE
jgi:CBS domain-containing protein